MDRTKYENPLVDRYASPQMSYIWSPRKKFSTWRRLWIALATAEKELGIDISDEQIAEMEANVDNIDFDRAKELEAQFRHDVMSHVHTFGECCPAAKPIIHLGATSCYVGDNTELIQLRESMQLVRSKLVRLIELLRNVALEYKDQPTLGFTHYQPAQLTTVGKRVTLWLQDFLMDLERIDCEIENLPFRGVKGTTGTQASFLELFEGDQDKVLQLNERVTSLMGFSRAIGVSGQTYSRKIDYFTLSTLSGIAQSAYKMAGDIRLLSNLNEMQEPFGKSQIGSSAMAYKRNPMRSERICSLARYVMSLTDNAAHTHANQWFERTLDDSANRRLSLPESFLGIDVIITLCTNVLDGVKVWPLVIRKRIESVLPFMATENILMACVKAGGDRQDLHEIIREHSIATADDMKMGKENDLLERIVNDPRVADIKSEIVAQMNDAMAPENYVGRAPQQVEEFITDEVDPMLKRFEDLADSEDDEVLV
jgi:adenylosuccinate lyase